MLAVVRLPIFFTILPLKLGSSVVFWASVKLIFSISSHFSVPLFAVAGILWTGRWKCAGNRTKYYRRPSLSERWGLWIFLDSNDTPEGFYTVKHVKLSYFFISRFDYRTFWPTVIRRLRYFSHILGKLWISSFFPEFSTNDARLSLSALQESRDRSDEKG